MSGSAPSTAFRQRQSARTAAAKAAAVRVAATVEQLLEQQRVQLPLWTPVLLALGIALWFALPTAAAWLLCIGLCALLAFLCLAALPARGRAQRAIGLSCLLVALGCLLAWGKALIVAEPVLARPAVLTMTGRVEAVEALPARGVTRLLVRPIGRDDMPARVRVNLPDGKRGGGAAPQEGDLLRLRVRLLPPARAALPGGYDFARAAWFAGIGATGSVLAPPERLSGPERDEPDLRRRLADHVASRLPDGGAGGIAVALATGDRGRISTEDEEAMRLAGLSHLLSISGLHVTALVGMAMILSLRLIALWPRLALGAPVMLLSALAGAIAAIGYTWLTGAQVPTIRSCVAALVVLAGVAAGREAIGLRTLAVGALFVELLWPEAVIGPSFQLSFTAVAMILALYESAPARRFLAPREERRVARLTRAVVALAVTGIAVEAALAPIVLFHFHKSGLLGMAANLVAIPLTEFVIMPGELVALCLDTVGLGAPAWWVVGKALGLILSIAHAIAATPGAAVLTPAVPAAGFAMVMIGLYWLLLWRGRLRWLGVASVFTGLAGYALAPVPDILVTADGRHVALRADDGMITMLRARSGDYVRGQMAEMAAIDGIAAGAVEDLPNARCSRDFCRILVNAGEQRAELLAARSDLEVPWADLIASCRSADIVVASRRLPASCRPRWLKLDRPDLRERGGAAIHLAARRVERSRDPGDEHPWAKSY